MVYMVANRARSSYVRKMVYASLFAALTAAGAWMAIPLPYVPVTLQTLFTMLSGALLGPYFGALAMIVYVLLGLIGLPVFAQGQSGLGVLLGPAGGYLIGFVVGAVIIGLLVRLKKRPGFLWLCLAMAIGELVVYVFGVAQLSVVAGMSLDKAIYLGALPFMPGDVLKIIVAALIARKIEV
jgi:biotin transport system substrate-specific component